MQETLSRAILEISQASGPRDSPQIRPGREQGTFHQKKGVVRVAELRESCKAVGYL